MAKSATTNCSFSREIQKKRLMDICNVIEFPFEDLISMSSEDQEVKEIEFSLKVQEKLLANLNCFRLYWKLAYEHEGLEIACKQAGINRNQRLRSLRLLEELELLQLLPDDKIKILKPHYLAKWIGNGPLLQYIKHEWSKGIIDSVLESQCESKNHFSLKYYKLTNNSYIDLLKTIEDVNKEFTQRSNREIKFYHKDKLKIISSTFAIKEGSPML